jgi:Zn-dependent peptidase ImmA (M78 family)
MRVENVNIDIIRQTANRLDTPSLSKFPKLHEWIEGTRFPTFNQLKALANTAKIPFGYFFLEDLPKQDYPLVHYRTQDDRPFNPSQELLDTIYIVQQRQDWARSLLTENGFGRLYFAGAAKNNYNIEFGVTLIRDILNLPDYWAQYQINWTEALRNLISRTEDAGIFVVMNGTVGNNTKRTLNTNEFRGFVLFDEIAPFVFINGKDSISGKIFTLIHEIAHIIIGQSASFDLQQLLSSDEKTERYCNEVTAEFLVPRRMLLEAVNDFGHDDIYHLAKLFKVSEIVVARRLLDTKIINKQTYFDFYNDYIRRVESIPKAKGGNYYLSAPYKISRRFFNLIHQSLQQGRVLYTDAFRLTGLNSNTYDRYLTEQGS